MRFVKVTNFKKLKEWADEEIRITTEWIKDSDPNKNNAISGTEMLARQGSAKIVLKLLSENND